MSVINKMLRDLDSRQAPARKAGHNPESLTDMAGGILIRNGSNFTERKRSFLSSTAVVAVVLVLTVCGTAGVWWYLNHLPLQPASASAPLVAAASSPLPVTVAPIPLATKTADAAAVTAATLPVVVGNPTPVDMPLKINSSFKTVARQGAPSGPDATDLPRHVPERPLAEPASTAMATIPAPVTGVTSASPRGRLPALDALAQAQSLWNAGSHEASMELVREAMAVVERASVASPSSASNTVLATLARELARMELAEGQVGRALEMLTQREPALSDFADIWALRGNAAQRLGRHEESVAAYLMALKLRPDETRWMLGAAVSLAAQGKTTSAAELAEKARASGTLSREVATYLRQLGVPLREH